MRVLATLLVAAVIAAAGAVAFIYSGVYDISASDQHTAPVFWVLKTTMRRAVHHHARDVVVPPLGDAAQVAQGRLLFVAHCTRCHGAPGVAPEPFALALRPAPANLANTGIEWPPGSLYWTIRNGLKLTAMPAWESRLTNDELWAIVAYVEKLPYETPRRFADELRASGVPPPAPRRPPDDLPPAGALGQAIGGDADRGHHVMLQYGCVSCHDIPGVVGAAIPVGPPLARMGLRSFIGGVLENTPENMVRWLRTPQAFVPDGAMPNLGVSVRDARDMAAYLRSLR
jgi:mono/diheme cytochrome c family protein